ncbi:MAG: fluoride efflux transporter CrcB [Muribaculaceae bacterium]
MWQLLLCVFLGSGLGGVTRFLVGEWLGRMSRHDILPQALPLATMAVNIAGCFIIGLVYGLIDHGYNITPAWRTGITVGFCGGLTTFSTFGRETFVLLQSGQIAMGLLYTALSVVIGVAAAWGGFALTR